MQTLLSDFMKYLANNYWLVKILSIIVFAFIVNWVATTIYLRVKPRLEKTAQVWDDALLEALHKPFIYYVWLLSIILILPSVFAQLHFKVDIGNALVYIQKLLFLFFLLWFTMRYISSVELKITQRIPASGKKVKDVTSVRAVAQLSRIASVVFIVLLGMNTLGISITALLAAGGVGGLAIGFAAKDTLSNFIGGMMIFWDRPFSVGDWVSSPDRQIEGTVEYIGWRLTRIRTFDKRPLYVPNGVFSTISIENPSRMTNRRIKTNIGVRYDDAIKIGLITRDIENMLRNHPEIDNNQTLMVNLFEFGPSSLNFFIYTFTKTTEWVRFQAIQQDVFLKSIDIINQHGAECAFPTTTVHVPERVQLEKKSTSNILNEGKRDDYGAEPERVS